MRLLLAALLVLVILGLVLLRASLQTSDSEARQALKVLERKLHLLVAHLQGKYPEDPRLLRLAYGWDGRLKESRSSAGVATNKQQISVCVRDAAGVMQDPMTAMAVGTHELAHLATESLGHTEEFWTNFRWLLKEAIAAGLYTYQEFRTSPTTYCGSLINSSPLDCLQDKTCE